MNKRLVLLLVMAAALLLPATASAQVADTDDAGVLLRVNGNVTLAADEVAEVVIVLNGDATILGVADAVVVVDGAATLVGATVGDLVVVRGNASLLDATMIRNDVRLIDAEMTRALDVAILGETKYDLDAYPLGQGFASVVNFLFLLGVTLAVMLAGLAAAAIAGRQMRAASTAMTHEFGKTMLAGLVIWIAVPALAALAFVTVVGIPTSMTIFLIVLPAFAFLGTLVAGIRLGDAIIARARGSAEPGHPYWAATVGLGILLLLSWIPFVAAIVVPIAAFVGGGAVALTAWRAISGKGAPTPTIGRSQFAGA